MDNIPSRIACCTAHLGSFVCVQSLNLHFMVSSSMSAKDFDKLTTCKLWEEAINIQDYLLIRKIIKGDEEAFDSLVKKHYNNIYHYCFRKTGNKEIAKDLTQEVFMKLIRSIHRYRFTGKFTNFLFTIAVNT